MNRRLNVPDTILEFKESAPGMWWFPTNPEHRCIYRVPHRLRRVSPEAYTPQLLLIGPLHHSLKFQAFSRGDITNTKLIGYLNMEEHKKIYLARFSERLKGEKTIDELRGTIEQNEDIIRASYSESTAWIESPKFVDMILHDSVFILEFLLRSNEHQSSLTKKTWDPIFEQPCLQTTVDEDLILLENQLPYFILEKLFDPIVPRLRQNQTLREIVITYFRFQGNIRDGSRFKHFTDLSRCVRVETLKSKEKAKSKFRSLAGLFKFARLGAHGSTESVRSHPEGHEAFRMEEETHGSREPTKTKFRYIADLFRCVPMETQGSRDTEKSRLERFKTHRMDETRGCKKKKTKPPIIKHMYSAAKLHNAGVKFKAVTDEFSIDVRFENGCLKIPCLWVPDDAEITLRNIMALEQCHYPFQAFVCNFVSFLDFLIDTDKDVDLLMENGILNNWGEKSSVAVAEMVNTLFSGVVESHSCYAGIAYRVNAYYENPFNRSRTILGRQYFGNLWRGTATVAAALLLVMTLIQTVASVMQVMQK
ncbi:hypothetical protein CARUB_v10019375mg [Capsella rubella]|uniref:Uncharacterized protein n=1 Tax=Capsella rubella TaxID=81985 RepID=R0FU08_9BRAS|nr:putative UPF0481 protein At3g02645 [Capsella rubella]EOA25986.1 hypothetical protein CARUB_v10019375mg [Capsella rubella]